MNEEIMAILLPAILSIVVTVLGGIATIVGIKVNQLVEKVKVKTGIEIDEKTAREAVEWTEQVFKDSNGPEKLEKAKDRFILLMNERGVALNEKVIDTLIEQAVIGLKKGWKESQVLEIQPVVLPIQENVNLDELNLNTDIHALNDEMTYEQMEEK